MTEAAADASAASRWRRAIETWALPEHVLAAAPESPWGLEVARFAVDDTVERETRSSRWAREVLPPAGGTVLDVGCGGGRSSIPLVPPASELIGVDTRPAMLERYVAAATGAGALCRTVHGRWPDAAAITPVADVVVCHHVVYDVADIAPFVAALTARARLAVVVELPVRHPQSAWNEAFEHFWELTRPVDPTHLDFVAVLGELELDPEFAVGPTRPRSSATSSPDGLVPTARRRLCLPADRDDELGAWLAEHPPAFHDEVATVRWAGAAEA